MAVQCTGDGANGDHCCYIEGKVCEFLDYQNDGSPPRCSLWEKPMINNPFWETAPVGRWFAINYPGFDCRDWPQNIPTKMIEGAGLCCWEGKL